MRGQGLKFDLSWRNNTLSEYRSFPAVNTFDDIYANNVSSQKILSTHYNSFYFDVLNGLSKKNKKKACKTTMLNF